MPNAIVTEEVVLTIDSGGTGPGRGGDGAGRNGGGGDGSGGGESKSIPERTYTTGITIALAAILMLFMALVSAFVVRKGASNDWTSLVMPRILWLNTIILIASSWTLSRSRKNLISNDLKSFRHWWMVTTILGLLFLVGQLMAWRILVTEGVYLASNPSSSFFYVFTAAHGLHLLGGIIGLLYVAFRPLKGRRQLAVTKATAMYWHFMDGLWVFIFLLFYLGQ
ncbi:MAG: heme-copper oxidase subunit III [Candidatus Acidiferrum sp.]